MMRMTALLALLLLPGIPEARAVTLTQIGTQEIAQSGNWTNQDTVFTYTNATLPIWRVSPVPTEVRADTYWASNQTDLYPFAVGLERATIIETVGTRRVGHQKWLNQQPGYRFESYETGTLAAALWDHYTANTNGKVSQMWSSRTIGSATWNANTLAKLGTNYTGLAYGWQGQSAAGIPPVTAISRRLAYTRGHGMGATGTNSANATKQIWFLTAANATITNTITEQVTSAGYGEDWTIFVLANALPETIAPVALVSPATLATKRPPSGGPHPILFTTQSGTAYSGRDSWVGSLNPGDSGNPRMIFPGGQLAMFAGTTTSAWSQNFSNACAALLLRNGLSLTAMPTVLTLDEYPTP
jgi:hypothetical protein